MAQPGVAREPSMEEILASIRKIIESNDPGAEKSLGGAVPPLYDEEDDEISLTIDEQTSTTATMFPANDHLAAPQQAAPAVAPEPARNVSLADLAARVRATVDRAELEPMAAEPVPAQSALRQSPPPVDSPLMPSRLASLRSPSAPVEPAPQMMPSFPAPAQSSPVAEETRPAAGLLSAEPGALVARSFGELAAALDGRQRRSLDEMAEEMLRPMLREWLDDNLPTLVERLVREEIERVARGPRR
ncbi:PopZ family protein [Pseudomonas sp. R2.Fl]|nr:PopZ family protein [Pseudomonas sp. R2.Fl]